MKTMLKTEIHIVVIIVAILVLTTQASGKELYVKVTGNDAFTYLDNDQAHPWKTLGRALWGHSKRPAVYPKINNTPEAAKAGDVVIVFVSML